MQYYKKSLLLLFLFLHFRMKVSADGTIRKLVIDEATMEDAGDIRVITNADETSCRLQVKRMNININLNSDVLIYI